MGLLKLLSIVLLPAWIAGTGSACTTPYLAGVADSPDNFLHAVYARYAVDGAPLDIDDATAATIYQASLLALMREDRRALQGEAGVLDADPLCACQDHDIHSVKWVLEPASTGRWSARVSFENLGSRQHVVLSLLRAPQGWRIADVQSENTPSLRASLQDEIHAVAQEVPSPATR
jgi:hypothetical protein